MELGTGLLIVGAALLGGGTTWWFMRGKVLPPSPPQVIEPVPAIELVSPIKADEPGTELVVAQAPIGPSSLVVQNAAGVNALAVTALPIELFDKVAGDSEKPPKGISRLNALLQAAPATALATNGIPENVFEVAINGPLIQARDSAGNLIQDTYRAMSKGADGKIAEHATLTSPDKVSNLLNAAAVWQIASIVVAQKHLADISARLESIETGMKRIEGKIDAKRQGILMGAIEHLREISGPIHAGAFNPTLRQSLEDYSKELLASRKEVTINLKDRIGKLLAIKDPDTIHADGFAKLIREEMKQVTVLFREWLLCSRARYLAWSLLTMMPGEEALKLERYNNIVSDLEQMMGADNQQIIFGTKIQHMLSRINAKLWSVNALSQLRRDVQGELDELKVQLQSEYTAELALVREGAQLLVDIGQPSRILVKTRGNEIIALKHLPANETPKMLLLDLQPSVFSPSLIQSAKVEQRLVD